MALLSHNRNLETFVAQKGEDHYSQNFSQRKGKSKQTTGFVSSYKKNHLEDILSVKTNHKI